MRNISSDKPLYGKCLYRQKAKCMVSLLALFSVWRYEINYRAFNLINYTPSTARL